MVLDVIELAKAHTGFNMAKTMADTLTEFGITKKVRYHHDHEDFM